MIEDGYLLYRVVGKSPDGEFYYLRRRDLPVSTTDNAAKAAQPRHSVPATIHFKDGTSLVYVTSDASRERALDRVTRCYDILAADDDNPAVGLAIHVDAVPRPKPFEARVSVDAGDAEDGLDGFAEAMSAFFSKPLQPPGFVEGVHDAMKAIYSARGYQYDPNNLAETMENAGLPPLNLSKCVLRVKPPGPTICSINVDLGSGTVKFNGSKMHENGGRPFAVPPGCLAKIAYDAGVTAGEAIYEAGVHAKDHEEATHPESHANAKK